ncbi:MAG: topoisomerase DNA-binding C4 zinc finger domain-containing protein [Promethearchaeota archaeon]
MSEYFKYLKFLGCTGHPNCSFMFDLTINDDNTIVCPDCGGRLIVRNGKYEIFLDCIKLSPV